MTNKIELVDILPTEQEIVNYGKYISSLNSESNNEDDYLLASLITAATFEMNKGIDNV